MVGVTLEIRSISQVTECRMPHFRPDLARPRLNAELPGADQSVPIKTTPRNALFCAESGIFKWPKSRGKEFFINHYQLTIDHSPLEPCCIFPSPVPYARCWIALPRSGSLSSISLTPWMPVEKAVSSTRPPWHRLHAWASRTIQGDVSPLTASSLTNPESVS